jgi:hypothetical protein
MLDARRFVVSSASETAGGTGTPPAPAHLRDLTRQAKDNGYFRQVLATGRHTQVVIMSIPPRRRHR